MGVVERVVIGVNIRCVLFLICVRLVTPIVKLKAL